MQESSFTFEAADRTRIFVYRWVPQTQARAVVQIAHGLAEHAARYRRLAEALTTAGYAVYASDLRGHGQSARTSDDLGFFSDNSGWHKCVDDLWQLNRIIATESPPTPMLMLGHSMGATLARQFMAERGDALAGVVLSGSSGQPTPLALSGRLVARAEKLRLGARGRSALIRSLTFDSFNKRFEPARTKFDWLSRDPVEVDKYAADPLCGFTATVQLWIDLLDAWPGIAKSCAGVPRTLPIYVISGGDDPVSAGTRTIEAMLEQYRSAGVRAEHKFYPGARHELLNETNREEVTGDLLAWMDRVLGKHATSRASVSKDS